MKEILILKDLEQIKAIVHPYRIEILECFNGDEPATAKQIADKMGEPHAKINYHIKTLQKVGILKLVDERVKSGIVEKYYLPAAKMFVIHKGIINTKCLDQKHVETFENITKDFYKGIQIKNEEVLKKRKLYQDCYLTDEEAKALNNKLEDTIENFIEDKKDYKRENTKHYAITSLIVSDEK